MAKNPDALEMNKLFDASFEKLLGEFVTASGALRNAQKYRGANANAAYLEFCSDRVNLLMSLLQYYKKTMSDMEKNLNQQLKNQRTPEQVLDVIRTYLKNKKIQLDKEDIEAFKKGACERKSVKFNPEVQYQEHPNTKIKSNSNSSSSNSNSNSSDNSAHYREISTRYGGKKKQTLKKRK